MSVRRINSHFGVAPHEYRIIIYIFRSIDDYHTLCERMNDLFLQVLKHVLIAVVVVKDHYYCYSILLFGCRLCC